ncbi:2060_t:CDS:1 [Paraglomus brasilianum]|uniref:2060_t:CDS:1 n=1 Tax=Paraglomus brasilianum TaxID=144538 RepID=A0A9N9AVN4_9GLOM|nr:2060_t:CDS:1 [Paraglomus brasilianum]
MQHKHLFLTINKYLKLLEVGTKFPSEVHLEIRARLKSQRDPHLILSFYNEVALKGIVTGHDAQSGIRFKLGEAIRKISARKVEAAYRLLKTQGPIHPICHQKILDKLACNRELEKGALDCYNNIIADGYVPDLWTYNRLLDCLCDANNIEMAWKILDDMVAKGIRPNVVTFNTLIKGFVARGDMNKVWHVFRIMNQHNIVPSVITYSLIMNNQLMRQARQQSGRYSIRNVTDSDIPLDARAIGCLFEGLGQVNDTRGMWLLYKKVCKRQIKCSRGVYNIVIKFTLKSGWCTAAFEVYEQMLAANVLPSLRSYNLLIKGFVHQANLLKAMHVFNDMLARGFPGDLITCNALIEGHLKQGNMTEVFSVLEMMREWKLKPDVRTLYAIIRYYVSSHELEKARELFDKMVKPEYCYPRPDITVYNVLIDGYLNVAGNFDEANRLFRQSIDEKLQPMLYTYNTLIRAHVKHRQLDRAVELFYDMQNNHRLHPDAFSFYNLIIGYLREDRGREAMEMKKMMEERKINNRIGILSNLLEYHKQHHLRDKIINVEL